MIAMYQETQQRIVLSRKLPSCSVHRCFTAYLSRRVCHI